MSKRQENKSQLIREIEKLKPHDHLCLIYESEEEWKEAAIPYISIGLESGQKCIYVCDNHTAGKLRQLLGENGTDVSAFESSGQLVITQESDTYTRGGKFDPDLMIELLIAETNKALSQGYPALRVTGEMTWVLKGRPGSERVLEYEAKLNRDLFPRYPCLAICQYERWKFDPEIIKGVIMTHPKLIYGTRVSDNFYYITTEDFLNQKRAEIEAQHWLNNIAREEKRKEELAISETWYRDLIESTTDMIWEVTIDGVLTYVSTKSKQLMGFEPEELVGRHVTETHIFDKDSREEFLSLIRTGKPVFGSRCMQRCKDGKDIIVESNWVPVFDGNGNLTGCRGIDRDITQRIQMEEDLLERERHLKEVYDNAPDAFLIFNTDGYIKDVNRKATEIYGYKYEEFTGLTGKDIVHPDYQYLFERFKEVVASGGRFQAESIDIKKDGSPFNIEVTGTGIHIGGERHLLAIVRDITDRKKTEQALKQERNLFVGGPTVVFKWAAAEGWPIEYVSANIYDLLGYTAEELMESKHLFSEIIHPDDLPRVVKENRRAEEDNHSPLISEYRILDREENIKWMHEHTVLIKDENGKVTHHHGYVNDITDRKRAYETLKESEAKYRFLTENMTDVIFTTDLDLKSTYVSPSVERILGFTPEESLKRQLEEQLTPASYKLAVETMQTALEKEGTIGIGDDQLFDLELEYYHKDGTTRITEVTCKPIRDKQGGFSGVYGLCHDITERKKAEGEKRELERKAQVSSRLASVGEMASGVAHEINNPLTGVIGFSELLMEKDLPEDIREEVRIIHDGSKRVADIVKRLLSFARQHKPERSIIDINELVENTLALRKYALETENIEVITSLDPDLPWTVADIGQLQQVFMNIIVNAEAEMKRAHGRGRLIVQTQQAGDMIRISFKDDGSGIARENLEKVFDPFFTTKPVGEGTGLGLSLSHGIIAEHKGNLYVESEEGRGATFFVEIPLIGEEGQKEDSPDEETAGSEATGGRILVIDDEPNILSFLKEVLAREGYDVETADNGKEALEMIRNTRYSAILCDIKLPEISGKDIYEKVGNIAPSLKKRVIFITGDVIGADTAAFLKKTKAPYLNKPVDIVELEKKIKGIISV